MKGADRLCDTLLANGVDVCFANPGTSEMHFVAALDAKPAMRCILGLFEGVVTGAADGYGRMADKPAATLLHLGAGLANGLANLHNARRAHTPLLNVVGDHASYHLVFDSPLTSDIETLAAPMSQWVRRIAGPDDVAPAVTAGLAAAKALCGVATLILPADAAWGAAAPMPIERAKPVTRPKIDTVRVGAAADAIRAAGNRAGLLLGGSALRADALHFAGRIAAKTGAGLFAPALISRLERGAGRVPVTRIPYRIDAALKVLAEIDFLVLIGESEPVAIFAYPNQPGRLTPQGCKIISLASAQECPGQALEALAAEFGGAAFHPPPAASEEGPPSGPLTEDAVSILLAQQLPDGAIVCDEGQTSARRFFALSRDSAPHDYLMITGGSIGIGLPLAVGAAVAQPDRKVIALQADGSALYTLQALWTFARENLDVLTILFSNRAYAILQIELRNLGVDSFGRNAERMMSLDNPAIDWVGLSKSFGVEAARADTSEGFARLLKVGLSRRGPFLIEAVI